MAYELSGMMLSALVDIERLADYSGAPEAARFADDVWISGWLAADGVQRVVVPLEASALFLRFCRDGMSRCSQLTSRMLWAPG